MLRRQLDRLHAFFQRPGVTPGRVAPCAGFALLGLALIIGLNVDPLDQRRASYGDGSVVVAGGGPQAQPTGATAAPAAAGAASAGDDPSDGGASDEGAAADESEAAADSAASYGEPSAEPSYSEPAPATSTGDEGDATGDTGDTGDDDQPTGEPAESYEGTVVTAAKESGSYAIATADQDLIAVHAEKKLPKPGDSVRVAVRPLANGTYAEDSPPERIDTAGTASFRGWITWVAPDGASYTVSARGVSVLIRRAVAGGPVALGAPVLAAVDIGPGATLTETGLDSEGERTDAPLHVAGVVGAVDGGTRTFTLSADSAGQSKATVTIAVHDQSLDLSGLSTGQPVDATVVVGADGTYTLTGLSGNGDAAEADDPKRAQGDQVAAEDPAATGRRVDALLRALGIAPVR